MTGMPPALQGLNDEEHAARLALAVFQVDRGLYDAAMRDAVGHGPELIYALVRSWIGAMVEHHGRATAQTRVEGILAGIMEHRSEAAPLRIADDPTYNPEDGLW